MNCKNTETLKAVSQLPCPIRVLLVEDDEDDFILTEQMLAESDEIEFRLDWVSNIHDAFARLNKDHYDVILVDCQLGRHSGMELLRAGKELGVDAPMIMLTGTDAAEIDMHAMRLGAADYVVKGQLTSPLLTRSIRYAMDRKLTEQRLISLVQTDDLTGLANRSRFREDLSQTVYLADCGGEGFSLFFIDIDRFKNINDTLGHHAGDVLLKAFADRLKCCVSGRHTLSRLGGDEFTLILRGIDSKCGVETIIQRILGELETPFQLEGQDIIVTASIGVAIYQKQVKEIDALIRNADMAMYRAKSTGRNKFHFHNDEAAKNTIRRMSIEGRLREALRTEKLCLHYQPQLNVVTGKIVGVEALARWQDPELGSVAPHEFISIAEEAKLIIPLGEWIMYTACKQAATWHADKITDLVVAINLSAGQFHDQFLGSMIRNTIDQTGADCKLIEFELTEEHILKNSQATIRTMQLVKEMGIRFAIDDFGTGYSSLSLLTRLPVDRLKIDQSFIRNVGRKANDSTVVRAMIELGSVLGLETIAEGVETQEQLSFLKKTSCEIVQGYAIAKPMSADALTHWLRSFAQCPGAGIAQRISIPRRRNNSDDLLGHSSSQAA